MFVSCFFGGPVVIFSPDFAGFGGRGGGVMVFGVGFVFWGGLFKVLRLSAGVDVALPRDSFSVVAKGS